MSLAFRGEKISIYNVIVLVFLVALSVVLCAYKQEIISAIVAVSNDGFAPLFIGASAFIAFLAAMFSAYLSRKTTKDRETVNYLMKMLDETELEDSSREILRKEREDSSISVIATLPHDDSGRIAIKRVLSHYETLATGVNNHIFNEKMLIDASVSKTITLYNTCIPYIRKIRDDGQKSAYCEFEEMAERWKKEKKRRDPSWNNL